MIQVQSYCKVSYHNLTNYRLHPNNLTKLCRLEEKCKVNGAVQADSKALYFSLMSNGHLNASYCSVVSCRRTRCWICSEYKNIHLRTNIVSCSKSVGFTVKNYSTAFCSIQLFGDMAGGTLLLNGGFHVPWLHVQVLLYTKIVHSSKFAYI